MIYSSRPTITRQEQALIEAQAARRRHTGRLLQAALNRRAGATEQAAYSLALAGCARRSLSVWLLVIRGVL